LSGEGAVCAAGSEAGIAVAVLDPGITMLRAAAWFTGRLFLDTRPAFDFVVWRVPGSVARTLSVLVAPAFSAADPLIDPAPPEPAAPCAVCDEGDGRCAAASVEANPPDPSWLDDPAKEAAVGSEPTLVDRASEIAIIANRLQLTSEGSLTLLHSSGQE